MRHNRIKKKISAFIDNELKEKDLKQTQKHIEKCNDCNTFHKNISALDKNIHDLTYKEKEENLRVISLKDNPYYQFIPQRRLSPILKPVYTFAALLLIVTGIFFVNKSYISPYYTESLSPTTPAPIKLMLDEGYLTVDTNETGMHASVITPWMIIEPTGTVFTVFQGPNAASVEVIAGSVIITSKKENNKQYELNEKEVFEIMEDNGIYIAQIIKPEKFIEVPAPDVNNIVIETWREKTN